MSFLALRCDFGIFLSNCCRFVTCFPSPDSDIVLHFIASDTVVVRHFVVCSEVNVWNTLRDNLLTCNSSFTISIH